MPTRNITFKSKGLNITGQLSMPAGMKKSERRPAFIVMHGFGSNMTADNVVEPCAMLNELGYVTLRFDMPGCGKSEGPKGLLICLDEVTATSDAITFLSKAPEVIAERIALLGNSLGGAVAIYTGGVDKRVAAVVSSGGWGNGERKFHLQHATPEAWAKFTGMLELGKAHRAYTGQSLMVPRNDIVPIPVDLSGNLAPGAVQMFPAETAQSMFDFRPENVIGKMAPRPLLLLHSSADTVTPTEESIHVFLRSGKTTTELHLFTDTDHFMLGEGNNSVSSVLANWLANNFPVKRECRC